MRNRSAILVGLALAGCATGSRPKDGLLFPIAPGGVTHGAAPRRLALLVGVAAFGDERFTPLKHAAADAEAMSEALLEFDERVVLSRPEQTTRTAILSAIVDLGSRIRSEDDTVLIYVSTHGSLGRKPGTGTLERYLVASDTRLDILAATGIPVESLLESVAGLPSKRVAVILAACHSGRGKSRLSDSLSDALAHAKAPPRIEEVSEALIVLTASSFGETAREDDALGHDVYTHFLLEGIKNGDRDGDGAVTLSEAHDYARERTFAFTGGGQRPTAESEILGVDPIVIRGARSATARPVVFSYARSAEGLMVVVDGRPKGALPGGVAVEPGQHAIELRDRTTEERVYAGELAIEPGERLDLGQLVPPPLHWVLGAELGGWGALSARGRNALLPLGVEALVRGELEGLLGPLSAELRLVYVGGSADAAGAFGPLPFHTDVGAIEVGLGHRIPLGSDLCFVPAVLGGVAWAARHIRAGGYANDASLRGGVAALRLGLELPLGLGFTAEGGVELGAIVATFDAASRAEPTLAAGAGLAF
jgi:hypothetical protein